MKHLNATESSPEQLGHGELLNSAEYSLLDRNKSLD